MTLKPPPIRNQEAWYLPTPEQIKEECRIIKEKWDDREFIKRATLLPSQLHDEFTPKEYEFPEYGITV